MRIPARKGRWHKKEYVENKQIFLFRFCQGEVYNDPRESQHFEASDVGDQRRKGLLLRQRVFPGKYLRAGAVYSVVRFRYNDPVSKFAFSRDHKSDFRIWNFFRPPG